MIDYRGEGTTGSPIAIVWVAPAARSGIRFTPNMTSPSTRRNVASVRSGSFPAIPVVGSIVVITHRAHGLGARNESDPMRSPAHASSSHAAAFSIRF